ncbi:MAG: hypothetical protein HC820_08895 [Hydrococcus sp. RM1_1_31]|nr:hypothetical protein [Hydrococcus sp. RM1_1_31]
MNVLYSTPEHFTFEIEAIAKAYALDLESPRAYLRLTKGDKENLTIQKLDVERIEVACYHSQGGEILPNPSIEFLIEEFDEDDEENHHISWTPLKVSQDYQTRQIAWVERNNFVAEFDSPATKEVADFCLEWAKEIEKQQWQVDGKPAPGVTATIRYFDAMGSLPILKKKVDVEEVSEDSPVLDFDLNYCIKGNRTGLLALIDAAAMALAAQSESTSSVFDFQADKHSLQISLCGDNNGRS